MNWHKAFETNEFQKLDDAIEKCSETSCVDFCASLDVISTLCSLRTGQWMNIFQTDWRGTRENLWLSSPHLLISRWWFWPCGRGAWARSPIYTLFIWGIKTHAWILIYHHLFFHAVDIQPQPTTISLSEGPWRQRCGGGSMWLLRRTCFFRSMKPCNNVVGACTAQIQDPRQTALVRTIVSLWIMATFQNFDDHVHRSIVFTDVLALLCFGPSDSKQFSTPAVSVLWPMCENWHRIAGPIIAMQKMWVMTKTERCCEWQHCKVWTFYAFSFTSNQLVNKNPEGRKFSAWFVRVLTPSKRWQA